MRISSKALIAAILISAMVYTSNPVSANLISQTSKDARELTLDAQIERELSPGEKHTYRIAMVAGQFARVVVRRKVINLMVAISGPDGNEIIRVGRNHPLRPETVSIVARESGDYLLTVTAFEVQKLSGRYNARLDELRPALPEDEKRFEAEKIIAEADQLRGQGKADSLRKAIEKYNEGLAIWRTLKDKNEEALMLGTIAMIHRALGDSRKALDYHGQSLPLFRESGDRLGEAETLNNMATARYALGDIHQALDLFNQALPIQREIGDQRGESSTLNNLGSMYLAIGEPLLALEHYKQTLPLRRAQNNRRGEAITVNNIGTVYESMGELQQALEAYLESLPIRREAGDSRGEGVTLGNIGQVYHHLGEPEKSLDYFERALTLRRAAGDRRGEGYVLGNAGMAHSSLGDSQKALDYINQALSIFREVGDRRGEALILNNIGSIYGEIGDWQKSLTFNTQALAACREVGDRRGEAQALGGLGRAYSSLNERDKSLEHYREALALSRSIKDPGGEAQSLLGLAEVERDGGNLAEARAHIESALGIIESLRSRVVAQDLRATYHASKRAFHDFYIELLMVMHRREPSKGYDAEALEANENARAKGLIDSLIESRFDIRQGVDRTLLEEERAIEQRLSAKETYSIRLLAGRNDQAQLTKVEREMEDLLTRYQGVQARIRAASPRYAALTRPAPLSLADIRRQALDDDTVLLEYALGPRRSFLWAVTSNSIASFELPLREEIESAARRAYELLTVSHRRQRKRESEIAIAELSRMLLGPVAGELNKKRLVIVADGALQYVPFAALPKPVVSGQRSVVSDRPSSNKQTAQPLTSDPRPLILNHEIVNLPSASVVALLRGELAGRKSASHSVAVLADPVFESGDWRIKLAGAKSDEEAEESEAGRVVYEDLDRATKEAGLTGLERLPFTRREAEAILAIAGERSNLKALDFNASRAVATGLQMAEYRIVHFATHGLINSRHPQLSGIVLSLVDEDGRPQEGFLRVHDIYNLKLGAELVVLSGCRTALGRQIRGEGLVGLVRGFMYAGAPRVVASLWDVKDEATAELMKRFYEKMLKEGHSAAAALRAAQLAMWKDRRWEAPYYWAGFVLQGEWK